MEKNTIKYFSVDTYLPNFSENRVLSLQNSNLKVICGLKKLKRPRACLFANNFADICPNCIKELWIPLCMVIGLVVKFLACRQKQALTRSASFDSKSGKFIDSVSEIVEKYQNWVSEDKYVILNRVKTKPVQIRDEKISC
jgi:hypothetical protein